MAQQPEYSSSELRKNANWHLRRAGLGMLGGLAVVTAGVFGKVAIRDIDQEWPPVLQAVGEATPGTAALGYFWYRRKTGTRHISAAIVARKAAKALDAQLANVLDLPPASLVQANEISPITPEIPVFDTRLPDDQFGVSEVVIPRALIEHLDQTPKN